MKMKRQSLLVALSAVLMTLLVACGSGSQSSNKETHQKVLNFGNAGDPRSLQPGRVSGLWEAQVANALYESLIHMDNSGHPAPGLAKSWDISPDGKTYTFHLRENLKFSDGSKLQADDVVYTFRHLVDPKVASEYAPVFYMIHNAKEVSQGKKPLQAMGVKSLDPNTVEVDLETPTPYFIMVLTQPVVGVVSRQAIKKFGKDWAKPGNLVGSGPYALLDRIPNDHITVVKNKNYWNAKNVDIDKIIFWSISDIDSGAKRFRAGELDFMADFDPMQLHVLKESLGKQVVVTPALAVYYYLLNNSKKKFQDVRVREAMSLLLDREAMAHNILPGTKPAYAFVPPNIGNYLAEKNQPRLPFEKDSMEVRIEKARKLMKEAGYGPKKLLKFQLSYDGQGEHKKMAVAAASSWSKAYMEPKLINQDANTHWNRVLTGDYDMARARWVADYNDPYTFLSLLGVLSSQYTRYKSDEFSTLMAQASKEIDINKRAKILAQGEKLAVMKDYALIPVLFYTNHYLVSPKITNFSEDNSAGYFSVSEWKMDESKKG